QALSHTGAATDGPYVYLAGGFAGDWKGPQTPVTRNVWRFDTRTNTWSAFTQLPQARGAGALVRVGRKLPFFGGVNTVIKDGPEHWVLDLRRPGKWVSAAPLPNPRNHLGYTELNGQIWAIGGQHELDETDGNDNSVHVYDPPTDRWFAMASLPLPHSHTHNST